MHGPISGNLTELTNPAVKLRGSQTSESKAMALLVSAVRGVCVTWARSPITLTIFSE